MCSFEYNKANKNLICLRFFSAASSAVRDDSFLHLIVFSVRIQLDKNSVHDSGRQEDLSVRNGRRSVVNDRTVEGLNQTLHAGLHVEVIFKKRSNIRFGVPKILLSKDQRGEKFFGIALEPIASYFDQCLLILIQD